MGAPGVSFQTELEQLLPDIPHREKCVEKASRHLELIEEANQQFNLTRIVDPREAAIKHIIDSLLPWQLFEGADQVLDAGTGAGFPGIPLAIVLPLTRFILVESTQKKARFVEAAAGELQLPNVEVLPVRAEDWLEDQRADIITARAVARLTKVIPLFAPGLRFGGRILLYKGPDAEAEIAEAMPEARKRQILMRVKMRYELPDAAGSRTIVELSRKAR